MQRFPLPPAAIRPWTRSALRGLTLSRALGLALVLVAGCGPSAQRSQSDGPSVVLLVIDTLRADFLGCYGNRPSPSPVLDGLAAEGVRFEQAFAQSSWTRPSFASFLTGLVPRATGIHGEEGDALHPRYATLAELLQGAGYTTIGVTANPNVNAVFGFAQGFDRYLDSKVVFEWMEQEGEQTLAGESPIQSADEILDATLGLIGDGHRAPYYLQIDLMEVHEYHGLKDPARDLMGLSAATRRERYNAAVARVDAAIGRFLAALRTKPGFEDALVIVTSDHGEGLDDHPAVQGAVGHGFVVYTSQAHVPLILNDGTGPLPRGRVVPTAVRLLDLFPTILEVARVDLPAAIDGRSLLPLVEGSQGAEEEARSIVVETHFRGSNKLALYENGWRLVFNRDRHPGTAPVELYSSNMVENGQANSVAPIETERAHALAEKLDLWERTHPTAEPWRPEGGIPEDIQRQLKGVGY